MRKLTNKIVDDRLIAANRSLTRIGDVINVRTLIEWQCSNCFHVWKSVPNNVLNNETGCPICAKVLKKLTNESIDQRLKENNRNIERCEDAVNTGTKIKWKCEMCTHIWQATPNSVLNAETGCPKCVGLLKLTNKSVDQRLKENNRNIERCENVVNVATDIEWRCGICTHMWQATPNNVLNNNTGCPLCAIENSKLTNELVDQRLKKDGRTIERIGNVNDRLTPIEWKCKHNHKWTNAPNNVLYARIGCPECQQSGMYCESYFSANPKKKTCSALVYLVEGETNGIKFLKVGITEKDVVQRYASNKTKYNIKELASTLIMLYDAFKIEQEILCKYREFLVRPDEDFGGKTECIRHDPIILANILRDYFNC